MKTELLEDAHIAQCEVCNRTKVVRIVLSGPYIQTAFFPKQKGVRHCAECYFKSSGVVPEDDERKLDAQFMQHAAVDTH